MDSPRSARSGHPSAGLWPLWTLFSALLAAQALLSWNLANDYAQQRSPGAPPPALALRIATLDEPALAGYATSLTVQGFDAQAGTLLALRTADAGAILQWLERAYELNPRSGYPLMLAAFDYAEPTHIGDLARRAADAGAVEQAPRLLDFVERAYAQDPARHWRWLAHASWVARYVLHDDDRALREAHALKVAPATAAIPAWARELDAFVLHQRDALDARRALLGGLAFGSPGTDRQDLDRLAARLADPATAASPGESPK